MSSDAEIRADLRLQLDKLGADTAKAAKMINKDLASSVKGLGETSVERDQRLADDKAARARRERAIRNRKLDEADEERDRKRRAAAWNIFERDREHRRIDSSIFERQMMAGMLPMFRPFSPWGTFFAGRQAFQAFSGTKTGQAAMGRYGLSGNNGAAIAATMFVAATTAMGVAIKTFQSAVANFGRSVDQARAMYASTLHSGYGLQTNYRLQAAGRAIGVDPNTVWQFGAAFATVAPRLQKATDILSKTNPVLTKTSWEFSILKQDTEALWASISAKAAPAIQSLIKSFDDLVKWLQDHTSWIANEIFGDPRTQYESFARKRAGEMATKETGSQGFFGMHGTEWRKKFAEDFAKLMLEGSRNGWKIPGTEAPTPNAYMRQLPASRWEHMGLIVGAGGGTNYAKDTAENTKKAAAFLATIAAAFGKDGGKVAGMMMQAYNSRNNTP